MTALKVEEELATASVGEAGSLTWLGHATVLLTTSSGTRIVFDPWVDGNPKSPITLGALGNIDGIAVTHGPGLIGSLLVGVAEELFVYGQLVRTRPTFGSVTV